MSDYDRQVREYLSYCRKAAAFMEARGGHLDPKYHPTADGCCKFVPHGGDTAKAAQIRAAFRELTGTSGSEGERA